LKTLRLFFDNFLVILCFSVLLGSGGESSDTENAAAKCGLIKSLNITNAENLEARVRKELEEQGILFSKKLTFEMKFIFEIKFLFFNKIQGILDPNEDTKDGVENDEILEELVRCQNELKAVSTHNLSQLKRLLKVRTLKFSSYMLRQSILISCFIFMTFFQYMFVMM
jgi:hypothetical protein